MNFLHGFVYPFRAFGFIRRHRELWGFVLVPILLNMLVSIALYTGLVVVGLGQIDQIGQAGGSLATTLAFLARVFYVLVLAVVVGWLMVRFGVVLGAPWYGQLAARIGEIISGEHEPAVPLSLGTIMHDTWRALQFELKKLGLTLAVILPSLLLNLIPLVGPVLATIIAMALGALIACLDFFDPPLERRRLRFRGKLYVVRQTLPTSAGFGLLAAFLVSIPLLNLVAIPLCVAGGTMLLLEADVDLV